MAFNRKAKLRDNIEAIRTLFELEKQGRAATTDERTVLCRYCGFGGLKCILNPASDLMDSVHWAKSDLELFPLTAELHRLIRDYSKDEKEYKRYFDSLKSSVLTAFYTPKEVVSALADTLHAGGITPNRLLDPSAGQGVFISAFEPHAPKAEVMAFDKDLITGKLLSHLYPHHKVRTEGFERIEKPFTNYFDVATSNIPFGDVAVFDPEFTYSKEYGRRSATKAIHNYFFLKGLDAVRDGGIVAFITSQGVLDSRENFAMRAEMFKQADFVSAVRLPNNLFVDSANTQVGSDLIVLQKNTNKQGLSQTENLLASTQVLQNSGIVTNSYFNQHPERIIRTQEKLDTDPYGKPAMVYLHEGGVEGIATDMRKILSEDFSQSLNLNLYSGVAQQQSQQIIPHDTIEQQELLPHQEPTPEDWQEVGEMMADSERKLWENNPPQPEMFSDKQAEKTEVKPEIAPPVMSLFDLFNFTEEERKLAQSGGKKKQTGRNSKRRTTPQRDLSGSQKATVQESVRRPALPYDPEATYAAIDWDTNPPINGFYEAMMRITPKQRKELRERTQETVSDKQATEKPVYPIANGFEEEHRRRYERHQKEVQQQEELLKPRPFSTPLEPHHREGSLVIDGSQIGYLKGITRYGATFHPLEMDKVQKEKAELYISIRDSYQHLYTYEAEMHDENKTERSALNTHYDTFVERYGSLNAKANVQLLLMDTAGRDMLSLERTENGQFIKADIFDHPVAFSLDGITHVDTPEEALSASLNRYGAVNLDYMETLCDNSKEELISELKGRIFFNPLMDNYEIKDRFIAGNVVEKAEQIEVWTKNNPQDIRVDEALTALVEAMPCPITFDEIGFQLGERWIPTGMYTAYARHLFGTDISISYSESIDEYSVKCGSKNAKVLDQYAVQGQYKKYDGINLLKNALVNTVPDITKSIGKDENGNDIKVRDSEAIQLANSKIDEIRGGFTDWLQEQSPEFQRRLADLYNRKFNCFVRPTYDGSHQSFPGLDLKALEKKYNIKEVYQSQKDCVWMLKQNGGGICDHEVGTGKTLIISIAAQEMKRLGMTHKPMIIGLKANVAEIAECYRTAYPNAKILYATEKDFSMQNRVKFFNNIKNNDWDCVIMSHDQFGKIPQSTDLQQDILQKELDSVEESLDVLKTQGKEISRGMLKGLHLSLTSCVQDELTGIDRYAPEKGIRIYATAVGHTMVETRAAANENAITDLHVLVFDGDNNLTEAVKAFIFTNGEIYVNLKHTTDARKVVVMANVQEIIDNADDPFAAGATFSSITEKLLLYPGMIVDNAATGRNINTFPMLSEIISETKIDYFTTLGTYDAPLALTQRLTKISAESRVPTLHIEAISLRHAPANGGKLLPFNNPTDATPVITDRINYFGADDAGANAKFSIGNQPLYIFSSDNTPDSETGDNTVEMIIKAKYGNDTEATYYHIRLDKKADVSATQKTLFDLKPGTHYKIVLTKVTTPGYPTLKEAIDNEYSNVEYDITDDTAMGEVLTNGQYMIGATNSDCRIYGDFDPNFEYPIADIVTNASATTQIEIKPIGTDFTVVTKPSDIRRDGSTSTQLKIKFKNQFTSGSLSLRVGCANYPLKKLRTL